MQSLKENQSRLRAPRGSREFRPALSSPQPRLSSWRTSVKLWRARLVIWQRNINCLRSWRSGQLTTRVGCSRRRTFCHIIPSERWGLLVHYDTYVAIFCSGGVLGAGAGWRSPGSTERSWPIQNSIWWKDERHHKLQGMWQIAQIHSVDIVSVLSFQHDRQATYFSQLRFSFSSLQWCEFERSCLHIFKWSSEFSTWSFRNIFLIVATFL